MGPVAIACCAATDWCEPQTPFAFSTPPRTQAEGTLHVYCTVHFSMYLDYVVQLASFRDLRNPPPPLLNVTLGSPMDSQSIIYMHWFLSYTQGCDHISLRMVEEHDHASDQ